MRWTIGLAVAVAFFGWMGRFAVAAELDRPVIAASDKAALDANDGKEVTVTGTIKKAAWSGTGKVMNVEFADSPLVAAVFEKNKAAIDRAFGGDAAKKWTGAKVKVSGKLAKYGGRIEALKGKPQIIIDKAEQVVIEEAKKD
jgi:hypothetical protein